MFDSNERDTLLLGDEAALYADAAYCSKETRDKLATFGIDDQVRRKGYRVTLCQTPTGCEIMKSPGSALAANAPLPPKNPLRAGTNKVDGTWPNT